jgi:hypothetical protein
MTTARFTKLTFKFVSAALFTSAAFLASFACDGFADPAQYVFTKIADTNSSNISFLSVVPVIDGDFVVYEVLVDPGYAGELWSWQISTNTYRKLVDQTTAVPGGTGHFVDLNAGFGGPVLKDGMVVFGASDQSTGAATAPHHGIFTVPAAGGPVNLIANYNTAVPGTGVVENFTGFRSNNQPSGNFSISQGVVVFEGTFRAHETGVYRADYTGANLAPVADSLHPYTTPPFQEDDFLHPSIDAGNVAFIGGTVFGPHGLYSTALPATPGVGLELANNAPGGTSLPVLGDSFVFDVSAQAVQVRNGTATFPAYKFINGIYRGGIFSVPVAGGTIAKLVTDQDLTQNVFPRITQGSDVTITSYSLDNNGQILFRVSENGRNNQALYIANNGTFSRVISNDDPTALDSVEFPIYDLAGVQPGSISNGRVVFAASSLSGGPRGSIFLAELGIRPPKPTPTALNLLSQGNQFLKIAKQTLPAKPSKSFSKKKRNSINLKRNNILAARKSLKTVVANLISLQAVSGPTIQSSLHGFTAANLKSLNKALKTATAVQSKTHWNSVQKLINTIGK